MLHIIGTMKEAHLLQNNLHKDVFAKLCEHISTLEQYYGADRNYWEEGGYVLLAETNEDLQQAKEYIDFTQHPYEWADLISKESGYISVLYLANNEYTITLFLPQNIAPDCFFE